MDRAEKVEIFSGAIAAFLWYSGISTYPGCDILAAASGSVHLTRFLRIEYAAGQCGWYDNAQEVFYLVLVMFSVAVLVTVMAFGYSIYRSSSAETGMFSTGRGSRFISSRELEVEKMKLVKVLVAGARIIIAIVASWALISIVAVLFNLPDRPIVGIITVTLLAIGMLIVLHRYQDKTRWERRVE